MKDILQAVLSQPPRIVVQKSIRLIRRRGLAWVDRLRDRFLPTYGNVYSDSAEPLGTYLRPPAKESLSADAEKILSLADLYLKHYFDLLGSGWVRVHYGMTCRGLEGHRYAMSSKPPSPESASILNAPNRSHSQKIRKMISAEYVPVDWQIDFKSGYRWREKRPSLKCRPAPLPGVDIKMPWELARMQHLPQLAWAFGLAIQNTEGALPAETYSHEFKNQVLDFIAANPPRFGVNWSCPMDVGIRAANWLAAYDLFRAQGATFDPDFNRVFKNSIHDHGRHIFHNLEWSPTLRSNHYLADIVGLLYIAAYLPQSRETDTWLALAVQELIREMNSQFHPDGSNFEASTSYHGLSGEMILYGTALILGLPDDKLNALKDYRPPAFTSGPRLQPAPMMFFPLPGSEKRSPLPPTHFERLERIAGFVRAATKPNGQIAQIGDNDSGRFLKLQPVYYRAGLEELQSLFRNLQDYAGVDSLTRHWVENSLNYGHLAQAIDHLLGKGENALPGFHAQIVKTLAGTPLALPPDRFENNPPAAEYRLGTDPTWNEWQNRLKQISQYQHYEIPAPGPDLKSEWRLSGFPDFGLYLVSSPRLFLAIRCGSVGQNGNGGHAHNDALAIEVQIDGVDRIIDPGSYLYTPAPGIRNSYRSVKAHFAPRLEDREPNPFGSNLFQLEDRARAECLYFGDKGFIGTHRGYGRPVYRRIQVLKDRLVIEDYFDGPETLVRLEPADPSPEVRISVGYGQQWF